jgi:hypothetical protein
MTLSNLLRSISRRHIPPYSWHLPSHILPNTEKIVFSTGINTPEQPW